MPERKFYAVRVGRKPGIYSSWQGEQGAARQVLGFPNAEYKSFARYEDAENWLKGTLRQKRLDNKIVHIYTDGSCKKNPGPGGYGVIIDQFETRQKLSAGFRLTTNNRMELMACIAGLRELKENQTVEIYTDSAYLVNCISKGWADRWRANDWMRNKRQKAENADLWEQLLNLIEKHTVTFHWLRGHAGHPENELCDTLAQEAASHPNLPPDPGYVP